MRTSAVDSIKLQVRTSELRTAPRLVCGTRQRRAPQAKPWFYQSNLRK